MRVQVRSMAIAALVLAIAHHSAAAAPIRAAVASAVDQCNAKNLGLLAPLSAAEKAEAIRTSWSKGYWAVRQQQDMAAIQSSPDKYRWADKAQTQQFAADGKARSEACIATFEEAVRLGADPSPALATMEAADLGATGYKFLLDRGAAPRSIDHGSYEQAPYGFLALRRLAQFDFFGEQLGSRRPSDLKAILDALIPKLDLKARDRFGQHVGCYVTTRAYMEPQQGNQKTVDAILLQLAASGADLSATWKSLLGKSRENLTAYYKGSNTELIELMLGKRSRPTSDAFGAETANKLSGDWQGVLHLQSPASAVIALAGSITPSGVVSFTAANGVKATGSAEMSGNGQVVLHLKNRAPDNKVFSDGSTEAPVTMNGTLADGVMRGTFQGKSDSGEFVFCSKDEAPRIADCSQ